MVKKELPEVCASRNHESGEPILIRRGESGYFPAPGVDPDFFNAMRGILPSQVEAMSMGSLFGWDVPGTDPTNLAIVDERRRKCCIVYDPDLSEFRVPAPDRREAAAYYTNDKEDAVRTALNMWRDENGAPIITHRSGTHPKGK